jgi:hypothetical protein
LPTPIAAAPVPMAARPAPMSFAAAGSMDFSSPLQVDRCRESATPT